MSLWVGPFARSSLLVVHIYLPTSFSFSILRARSSRSLLLPGWRRVRRAAGAARIACETREMGASHGKTDANIDVDTLQRHLDAVRAEQELVLRQRAELRSMNAGVEANLAQFKERVKLNVGGTKFETTLSTLTRYPDSLLAAMFSGRHKVQPCDDGYIFIDRDGTHFQTILNCLRSGKLSVPTSVTAATELQCEMEYYQLPWRSIPAADSDSPAYRTPSRGTIDSEDAVQIISLHQSGLQKLQAQPSLSSMLKKAFGYKCHALAES